MINHQHITEQTSAASLREQLSTLKSELAIARQTGLAENPAYMADLALEMSITEAAYIGAAVTEIASLRAELSGPLFG